MKFIKYLIGAVAAIALLASCDQKTPDDLSGFVQLELGTKTLEFPAEGGEETIILTTNAKWAVSCSESWIEVTPNGTKSAAPAEPVEVVVKVAENTADARTAEVRFSVDTLVRTLTVSQAAGKEDEPVTPPVDTTVVESVWHLVGSFNEWVPGDEAYALTQEGEYFVFEGLTLDADAEIKFQFADTWDLNRGGLWAGVNAQIAVEHNGANIAVPAGSYDVYLSADEAVSYAYFMEPGLLPGEGGEEPEEPAEPVAATIAEVLAAEESDLVWYEITGTVTTITNTTYGNFYIEDETGSIYVYGLLTGRDGESQKFASLGVDEGDQLTLVGLRSSYNEEAQMKDAYYVSHVDLAKPLDTLKATVAEVLAAEVSSAQWYEVTGTIANITGAEYGNFDLVDGNDTIYVYGLTATKVDKNDKSFASLGLKEGDIVTLFGTRAEYKGTPQIGGPAYYKSHVPGETEEPEQPEEPAVPVIATVAEVLAAEVSADQWYEITGTITNLANTTYGNFDLVDETGTIYVYGLTATKVDKNDKSFESLGLKEGDIVTLYGTRAEFNGTAQIGGPAYYKSHVPGPVIATVAEVLAAAVSADQWYEITGTITNLSNTTYGNFDLVDETGTIYVYGLTATKVDKNDKSFESLGLKEGDIVTLYGTRAEFNGTAQIGGPAYYKSHVPGETEEPEQPEDPEQPSDAVYTSNVDIVSNVANGVKAYAHKVKIAEIEYDALKLGTKSEIGSYTTPALGVETDGACELSFYAMGWKGSSGTLTVTVDGVEHTVEIAANDAVSGNSPYTIAPADSDRYTISLTGVTSESTITFTTSDSVTRAIVFGANLK